MTDCRVQISRDQKAKISTSTLKPIDHVPDITGCPPLRKSSRIDLPVTAALKPRRKEKQSTTRNVDVLLSDACKKLEFVQRERYEKVTNRRVHQRKKFFGT